MADTIYQQQIQRLQSSLRQNQDRNATLIRNRQIQQLQQLQQQQQRQEELIRSTQSQQSQSNASQRQEALRILIEKGKGSSALYSLSPQERAEVEAIASELKAQGQRNQARMAVSQAKAQILKNDPNAVFGLDFEQGVYQEALQRGGNVDLTISSSVPAQTLVNDAQFKYYPQQQQKEVIKTPLFKNTPQIYPVINKAKEIYGSPTATKIREGLSGKTFAKYQATSGNRIVYDTITGEARFEGVKQGTPEYEKAVQSAMTGQTLSSAVLGSIAGVPQLPRTIKIPLREVYGNPFGAEFQQPVITSQGQQRVLSSYQIFQERQAPTQVLKSSKDFGLLGSSDNIAIRPAKYRITSTAVPVVDEGTAITLTTKSGKVGELESLKGKSITIEPEEFLKNIAKREGDKIIKALPENSKLSLGYIERDSLGFALPEKVKTRYQTSSITNKIVDNEGYDIFTSNTFFRNLDKQRVKSPPSINMLVLRSKKPIFLDVGSEVNFIPKNPNVKKTPLSVTFQREELIQTPKPIPSKVPKAQIISKGESSKSYGKLNVFAGSISRTNDKSGLSDKSDFSRGFADYSKNSEKAQAKETARPKAEVIDLAIPKVSTSQVSISIPKQSTSEFNLQSPKGDVIQSPIDIQSPKQTSGLISLLRSAQNTQQKNMLRNILKARLGEPSRTPSKNLPRIPILSLPKSKGESLSKEKVIDSLGFITEVKKRGKYYSLGGIESSIGGAVTKGIRFVDTDISRSFRIRNRQGELVDVASLPFGFARSRSTSKVFVEQPIKAISTFGEKRTLQMFRKAKRRSKNVRNFFGI